jgi:8-oxo-dGTP pyrophosphatase MutT (NUDIX family)
MGFPGGYIESGEPAGRAAIRELQVECALQSSDWSELGACCIDGNRGDAEVHFFIAWGCTEAEVIPTDDLEAGDAMWIGVKELRVHLELGRFRTLGAYAAALRALPVLEQRYAARIR